MKGAAKRHYGGEKAQNFVQWKNNFFLKIFVEISLLLWCRENVATMISNRVFLLCEYMTSQTYKIPIYFFRNFFKGKYSWSLLINGLNLSPGLGMSSSSLEKECVWCLMSQYFYWVSIKAECDGFFLVAKAILELAGHVQWVCHVF